MNKILIDTDDIDLAMTGLDEDVLYRIAGAVDRELKRRADSSLPVEVRAVFSTAVAVLCHVEHSSGYMTAAPRGVRLADGTVVEFDRDHADTEYASLALGLEDTAANLAAIDGAIQVTGWESGEIDLGPLPSAT